MYFISEDDIIKQSVWEPSNNSESFQEWIHYDKVILSCFVDTE